MFATCPFCERKSDIRQISKKEKILVRDEPIETSVTYYKCPECGKEFLNTMDDNDPLDNAYHKYRKIKNMLQPGEIKELRKSLGLTQQELSNLFGWGKATLSRYENGSLQDKGYDTLLKNLKDPIFVLHLIKENPLALSSSKRHTLINKLKSDIKEENNLRYYIEEYLAPNEIDEKNGYVPFSIDKIDNLILFFCMYNGLWKTSINKYLFYADFKHFKKYINGITGSMYKRLPYGPVPENYEMILGRLVDNNMIQIEEAYFKSGTHGEQYKTINTPDLTIFSETEYEIAEEVKKYFKNYGAKDISDFSHKEKGYQETPIGEYISYDFAKDLRM